MARNTEEEHRDNDDNDNDEEMEEEDEEVEEGIRAARKRRSTQLPQYLTALVLSLTGFSFGTVMGWSGPGMKEVLIAHRPGTVTLSWVAASMPIGGFTASILTALTLNRYGRKKAMLGIIPVYIAGWIILAFGDHLAAYFAGRYITGLCGGSYSMIVPIYMGEIAQKEIRGRLSMIVQISVPLGLLYIYSVGFSLNITVLSLICTIPNFLFFVLMLFIPESPRFLISHGKEEEANKALQWFRGPDYRYVGPELRKMRPYSIYTPYKRKTLVRVFRRRTAKIALLTSSLLMVARYLTGINVVLNYSVYIFKTYIEINFQVGNIIILSMMILGASLAMLTIERLGRRKLLILSHSGLGVCHFLLAIFYWVITDDEDTHWLAVAFTSSFVFIFALGAGPLPWIMLGELFPYQVKPLAVGLSASISWLCAFCVAISFKLLEHYLSIGGVHSFYGSFCFINTIVIYFLLIETTGRSLEQIQRIFRRHSSLIEARRHSSSRRGSRHTRQTREAPQSSVQT